MPTSLGISVGASGVGSALRVDAATTPTTEFRRLAAESQPGRDLGDLVFDAVSLTSVQGPRTPDIITVAYRTEEQATEVRVAAERAGRMVRLVPETAAALAYLHTVGVRREPGAIAIVDIGATGTTVSILDRETGTLLRSARTEAVGGAQLAARVLDHVRHATDRMRTRRLIDPDLLAARCQGAQEALTSATSTRIDIAEAGPKATVTLTRSELDELTAEFAADAAAFTRRICSSVDPVPDTLALIGGAAASPALTAAISADFHGEIVTVPEPGAAAAIGAALSGDTASVGYTLVGSSPRPGNGSPGRVSGAVAGLLVLSAIAAGYATQHFTERDNSEAQVSPLFTGEPVPTQDAASGETAAPSHYSPPEPASSRTREGGSAAQSTVPWPLPTVEPTAPATRDPWPTAPQSPITTVTPTPIDQVPTPGLAPEAVPETTRPSEPADPMESTEPGITTTPEPTEPTDPAILPDTTEPSTSPPPSTGPAPSEPDPTTPDPGTNPSAPSPTSEPPVESPVESPVEFPPPSPTASSTFSDPTIATGTTIETGTTTDPVVPEGPPA
ncbi:Hsp70 family protein [Rhodococcus sp. NPDC047139]|uniref:Hsp70 family protein n=1 Tax=Rhodococcus sp. NPDC047139 TaxID=3155141 RepID=UPI0033CA3041